MGVIIVSMLSTTKPLAPEERRAIEVFCNYFVKSNSQIKPLSSTHNNLDNVVQEGNFTVFPAPLQARSIPSEKFWRWNQTKAQVEVTVGGHAVVFSKLIPRRTQASKSRPPSYKLWQYHVNLNTSEPVVAFWCEKGVSNKSKKSALDTLFCNVSNSPIVTRLHKAKLSFICN